MSWDGYVDNLKTNTANDIEDAAILGIDGSVWAKSSGMEGIQTEEAQKFSQQATSYNVCGEKYLSVGGGDGIINMKSVNPDSEGNKRHITVAKSNKCYVLGKGKSTGQAGNVCNAVCKISDHLKQSGY